MEKTFIMIKPDGINRNLIGEIISKFEKKGYKICALKIQRLTLKQINKHYAEHINKKYFKSLKEYLMSGPVVQIVLSGYDVVNGIRKIIGSTDPKEACCGSIRGDYGFDITKNLIHASDSKENAYNEIKLYFKNSEIINL